MDDELDIPEEAYFMTIRLVDDGIPELDIGSFTHWEAIGILEACVNSLHEMNPEGRVLTNGVLMKMPNEADEDEGDLEHG